MKTIDELTPSEILKACKLSLRLIKIIGLPENDDATQAKIAKWYGLSQATVSRILAGKKVSELTARYLAQCIIYDMTEMRIPF